MKNFYQTLSEPTEQTERTEERLRLHDFSGPGPKGAARPRGWILYDGECRYCIAAAKQFSEVFGRRGFRFLPLQTPWVQWQLHLIPGEPLTEMRVLTSDGPDFGGADAVLFLARRVWWLWPLSLIGRLPGMHRVVHASYRWIAAHRGCTHLKCDRPWINETGHVAQRPRSELAAVAASLRRGAAPASYVTKARRRSTVATAILSWVALIILPSAALITRPYIAPWVFMWIMSAAIFLGCKWLTLHQAIARGSPARLPQALAYLFLWAGMDAESFLRPQSHRGSLLDALPKVGLATSKIAIGALLLFGLARNVGNELLAGWIGMAGTILILHFGLFDLAAIFWQMTGFMARPIMNAPWKSASLTEFWGRRWNGAFNQLVLDFFFRRFARSFGTVRATLTTFLISGLIHELVISLPAGAGYGLPTGYFLLQGWGVIAQRTPINGRTWFQRGFPARIFTLLLVAAPAFWLFHPPFVHRVIIPFMQAIGAL